MAKRKNEQTYSPDADYVVETAPELVPTNGTGSGGFPETEASAQASPELAFSPPTRKAKAPRNVIYLIVGVRAGDSQSVIVGRQHTKGRCRQQLDMLMEALKGAYSDFVIIKGRVVNPAELVKDDEGDGTGY